MKKVMYLMLTLALITVTACAQQNKKKTKNMETKTLVAYFSATGTTAAEAENVAKATDGQLYEIKPEVKYTEADLDWTNKQARSTVEMKDKKSRPAIVKDLQTPDQYTTIYIGFPIWWYTAPTIINTFLESYNFNGKDVVLFATSGGSTPEKALKELQATYPNIHFRAAWLLNGASVGEIKDKLRQLK